MVYSIRKRIMPALYKNARIISIHHDHAQDKLIMGFEGLPVHEFTCVVDFALHGFYPQNILFDIHEYNTQTLPAKIAAEFPLLSYYLHSGDEWQIFYLSPQAGMGGVIVCATL